MASPFALVACSQERYAAQVNGVGIHKVISDCLAKNLEIDGLIASHITEKIFEMQGRLNPGQAIKFAASDILPFDLLITKERIHCLFKKAGQGSFSIVFETLVIPTVRHDQGGCHFSPGKPQTAALKMTIASGKTAFTPEKKKLEIATGLNFEGIDHYIDTFKDDMGVGYCLNIFREFNLSQANFTQLLQPVVGILKVLVAVSKGLQRLHQNGYVHRDIKGANILVSMDASHGKKSDAKVSAVLTDFGFLQKEQHRWHSTTGTPYYLDPSQFGCEMDCLYNQKQRWGIQSRTGDVYSLSMTIYRDIIRRLVLAQHEKKATAKTLQAKQLLDGIKVNEVTGPFTVEDLRRHSLGSRFRKIYYEKKGDAEKDEVIELIYEFPPLDRMRFTLLEAISCLDESLSPVEVDALKKLAELSCQMQMQPPAKRPTISNVLAELLNLLKSLNALPINRNLLDEFNKYSFDDEDDEIEINPMAIPLEPIPEHSPLSVFMEGDSEMPKTLLYESI